MLMNQLKTNNKLHITIFCLIFITLMYFLHGLFLAKNYTSEQYDNTKVFDNIVIPSDAKNGLIEKVQQCLVDNFSNWKFVIQWIDISNMTNACARNIISLIPYFDTTPAIIEHKFYMIPRMPHINDSCSVVTFGIGGDIDAEKHIKMVLPHCTFLGFDPNGKYKNLFEDFLGGRYIKAGVKGRKQQDTILQLNSDHKYQEVKEKGLKSAAELLETHHGKNTLIDILNIDIEGFEYSIIEDIIKKDIYQNVCQINFELHPVWINNIGYSFFDVINMFVNIAKDGTFMWVKTTSNRDTMYCVYFVNVKNTMCVEKYLKDRLM